MDDITHLKSERLVALLIMYVSDSNVLNEQNIMAKNTSRDLFSLFFPVLYFY